MCQFRSITIKLKSITTSHVSSAGCVATVVHVIQLSYMKSLKSYATPFVHWMSSMRMRMKPFYVVQLCAYERVCVFVHDESGIWAWWSGEILTLSACSCSSCNNRKTKTLKHYCAQRRIYMCVCVCVCYDVVGCFGNGRFKIWQGSRYVSCHLCHCYYYAKNIYLNIIISSILWCIIFISYSMDEWDYFLYSKFATC